MGVSKKANRRMALRDASIRPLLAAPAPTAYPILSGPGNAVGEQKKWSIGPVFACFSMQELSPNCCCANCCFPCSAFTWGNALHYLGIGSTFATLSSAAAGIDYGDSGAGQAAQGLAQLNAALSGQQKRRELIRALGLFREGDEGLLLRCCCMSCVQCQEIDTVFSFYRDSLGYRDIRYGSCWSCACTRFYATDPTYGGQRVVPFPEEIMRGESAGPNYPKSDFPRGYYFDGGVPKARSGKRDPESELPLSERKPRNSWLPGYLQGSNRGVK